MCTDGFHLLASYPQPFKHMHLEIYDHCFVSGQVYVDWFSCLDSDGYSTIASFHMKAELTFVLRTEKLTLLRLQAM
jgi:hypothetical protein